MLISNVGRAKFGCHGLVTATHQYTCTKGTQAHYFFQGMQLHMFGNFGPGTSVQMPRSYTNVLSPAFKRIRGFILGSTTAGKSSTYI